MVRFLPCTSTRLSDGVLYVVRENSTYLYSRGTWYSVPDFVQGKIPRILYIVAVPGTPGNPVLHVDIFSCNYLPVNRDEILPMRAWLCSFDTFLNKRLDGC